MWRVQLFKLNYDEAEANAVQDVISSGWITMGEKTLKFEAAFESCLGNELKATAVSSGTAALHMAMLALGIGPGDEVIVPALTFIADVNVVRLSGAEPVLADCVSLENWNMNPQDIEQKITDRTKAVLIVHYAGYACPMDEIVALCRERGLFLIEDCAHAPGAIYKGRSCGAFGDISCFSFFTNKNLSVGEGGMYVTRSEELHLKGRHLRSHGMSTLTLDRHLGRAYTYDVLEPGLNYRMDEMRAALGLVQLVKLEKANGVRQQLMEHYRTLLAGVPGAGMPFLNYQDGLPSYHICPILLDTGLDREQVMSDMKDAGVQTSIHYPSFKSFSAYKDLQKYVTPVADEISLRELTLPLYPGMGFDAVDIVVDALKSAIACQIKE
jgi:dTDP-4-amino-4,6-dideoxygalactose transaminase